MRVFRAVALFFCAVALWAQTDRGSITGTITDATGAVVPQAAIELRNIDTGAVYSSGTSATGNFVIQGLPIGTHYQLTVTAQGFKKFVRENLEVTVATAH